MAVIVSAVNLSEINLKLTLKTSAWASDILLCTVRAFQQYDRSWLYNTTGILAPRRALRCTIARFVLA